MTSKKGWLMLLAGVVCVLSLHANAAAFSCDVYVGNSEGVSLTFGSGNELKPFPPFSAMFGVKDVFLANPANYTDADDVEGDMARLGTVRTDAGKWVIVANSNATLKFEMTGASKIYVAYLDPKTEAGTTAEVANGETLSVKAGVSYTVSLAQGEPAPVSEDKMSQNVAIKKNEDKAYVAEKNLDGLTPGATYTLYFATDGSIGQRDGESWQIGLEGASGENWAPDKSSVEFTAESSTVTVTMEGSGSAKPLTATLVDSEEEKIAAINAILQKFGTLDFDDNGVVNGNDATFFYNYVSLGGADFVEEIIPYADSTITDDLEGDAAKALEFFWSQAGDLGELSLVEADTVDDITSLSDSATFFYNYMSLGGADFPEEITPYTNRGGNSEQDLQDAQEAMDKIAELME